MADYISINGKESKFSIKLSGNAEKVIAEIQKHTNEKGYFNFELCKRKEPGKYGETHYVKVDDWTPTPKAESTPTRTASDAASEVKETTRNGITTQDLGDLPF